ncbi:242_t:CDS:2 [Entrophospora sp. SA101]|nr:242_t:CDS:2 [Entrophospora sp. SA101]
MSIDQKITYNQKVEQGLMHELSVIDLFNTAMKKKICYTKAYENQVTDNIDDQSARTLVYNEIRALLPGIIDVNKLSKLKKSMHCLKE